MVDDKRKKASMRKSKALREACGSLKAIAKHRGVPEHRVSDFVNRRLLVVPSRKLGRHTQEQVHNRDLVMGHRGRYAVEDNGCCVRAKKKRKTSRKSSGRRKLCKPRRKRKVQRRKRKRCKKMGKKKGKKRGSLIKKVKRIVSRLLGCETKRKGSKRAKCRC